MKKSREYYIRNLFNVFINCDKVGDEQYIINAITINNTSSAERRVVPKVENPCKLCVQEFENFYIVYPMCFVLQWPSDIWLPNPEAEYHMLDALKWSFSGVLGYWNDSIFLFVVKRDSIFAKKDFETFFQNINSITIDNDNNLVIKI